MSFDDVDEVAEAKSERSTSATESPCAVAASAMPAPMMPAADHEQVEPARLELLDCRYAIHKAFVQAFVPSGAFTSTRP